MAWVLEESGPDPLGGAPAHYFGVPVPEDWLADDEGYPPGWPEVPAEGWFGRRLAASHKQRLARKAWCEERGIDWRPLDWRRAR